SHLAAMFHRFEETSDFAVFYQAAYLIGHGHFSPYSSVGPYHYPHFGFPYIDNHFELLTWLFAPLLIIFPSGLALLILAALAVASAQVLTACWMTDVVLPKVRGRWGVLGLVAAVEVLVFANPWYGWGVFFDFHVETLTLPFFVGTGYAVYRERNVLAIVLAIVVAMSGDVQSTYLIGLALALAITIPGARRVSVAIACVGLAFFLVAQLGHFNLGSDVIARYAYLGTGHPTSLVGVAISVALHPSTLVHTLMSRAGAAGKFLLPGLPGLVSPLGFFVGLWILLPDYLATKQGVFLPSYAAFQTVNMQPYLAVGAAMLIARVQDMTNRMRLQILSGILGVVVFAGGVAGLVQLKRSFAFNATVNPSTAAQLAKVLHAIPANAEVIAAQGIGGRFAGRVDYYPIVYDAPKLTFPVTAKTIYLVVSASQGIEALTPKGAASLQATLMLNPAFDRRTSVLLATPNLDVYRYDAPKTGVYVTF
nr:DUF2079 domain-containing protein [Actinomycetota bacterium]